MMKLKYLYIAFFLVLAGSAAGQSSALIAGLEFQAYPTGLIPGIRLERVFAAKKAVHLRLGYQLIDHRDQGKHDDETGTGYGFTLGYKQYLKEGLEGLHLGVRNDLWFNEIDWKQDVDGVTTQGTSNITVVQPTAEAGYSWQLGSDWLFTTSLAFGFEVNVHTKGEATGEGAILLVGLQLGRRF